MTSTDIPYDLIKSKGYDSIMFCPADNNFIKQKNFGMGLNKSYRYRIFDSKSALPIFFVKFNPTSNLYSQSSKRICEECEVKDVDKYCHNCRYYLCSECSSLIHGEVSNDKEFKSAISHNIDSNISKNKTGKCFYHPEKDAESYCRTCELPICSYCIVMGSHSKNEAAGHQIEEIQVVFKKAEEVEPTEGNRKKVSDSISKIKSHLE